MSEAGSEVVENCVEESHGDDLDVRGHMLEVGNSPHLGGEGGEPHSEVTSMPSVVQLMKL